MMDQVELRMAFNWKHAGTVSLDVTGRVRFPVIEARPGLYRFEFSSDRTVTQYIGETDRLSRRLQNYRTPGRSQQTNLRLNRLLVKHLQKGNQVFLSVVDAAIHITSGTNKCEADLSAKCVRILLESAALINARVAGVSLLNLGART
jgi:hypothetical protein